MQSKSLLKMVMSICVILLLVPVTFEAVFSQPGPSPKSSSGQAVTPTSSKAIELKAVSFQPRMASKTKIFKQFADKVAEASKGEINIKILGGPEVIGVMEQGQGVSRGVADMAMLPPGLIQGMVPESMFTLLSRVTQEEEIKRGVINKLQPFYNKVNLFCLGEIFGVNVPQFMTFTTSKKIEKPQQLAGMSIGGTGPMTNPIAGVLGVNIKVIPLSEVYTALERKVVDGWISPASGIVASGAYEQLKYGIDHSFFADNVVIIMNLNKWKSFSTNLQNILQNTLLAMAPELGAINQNDEAKARQTFREGGVQFIKFSPDDAEWYINSIYDAMWNAWIKQMPQTVPEFRKLLSP
jgi:TRAP-type transport system periplasmic protein